MDAVPERGSTLVPVIEDPVVARRRKAMSLLREAKQPVARVVVHHEDAVLWLDSQAQPWTTFVTVTPEGAAISPPHAGFVV